MKNIIYLTYARIQMVKNFSIETLKLNQMFISVIVIIPLIIYILVELLSPKDISDFILTSNVVEFFNSYTALFQQLFFYTLIFIVPIYIMITQINIRSFNKYKNKTITFKEISIANVLTLLFIINNMLLLTFFLILLKTASTLLAICLFLLVLLLSFNIIVVLLYIVYFVIINYVMKVLNSINVFFMEIIIVSGITMVILYITNNIPLYHIINTPSYYVVSLILLIFLSSCFIFKKVRINDNYIMRNHTKQEKVFLNDREVKILENYFIMIIINRKQYMEYAFSLIVMCVMLWISNLLYAFDGIVYSLMIPLFLISHGIICSFKKWYELRKKKVFVDMMVIHFFSSTFMMFIIFGSFNLLIKNSVFTIDLLLSFLTYILLMLLQTKIKLEFGNDNKSPVVFIMVYGTLSFTLFQILSLLVHNI